MNINWNKKQSTVEQIRPNKNNLNEALDRITRTL